MFHHHFKSLIKSNKEIKVKHDLISFRALVCVFTQRLRSFYAAITQIYAAITQSLRKVYAIITQSLRNSITQHYAIHYAIALRNCFTQLLYAIVLRNCFTQLFYAIVLRIFTHERKGKIYAEIL